MLFVDSGDENTKSGLEGAIGVDAKLMSDAGLSVLSCSMLFFFRPFRGGFASVLTASSCHFSLTP
jgi:hypothetical protein